MCDSKGEPTGQHLCPHSASRVGRILIGIHLNQLGGSLPAALLALALGVILLVPLFSHVSGRMIASRSSQDVAGDQYATDAGVEYGVWKLRNDPTFRSTVDSSPLTPFTVTPAVQVNGVLTATTASALYTLSWSVLNPAPGSVEKGGALAAVAGGDTIYAFRGDKSNDFWGYSISGNSWFSLANTPQKVGEGGALAYPGGVYVYGLRGDKNDDFWRYDIPNNSWNSLPVAPARVGDGGALVYAGGLLYALRGDKSTDFWRYSIVNGNWTPRASTPDRVAKGGSLAYTGGDFIYATQGDKNNDFWRYSISGDSWTPLANTPGDMDDGGSLLYTGGDYIYAFPGGKSNAFWRYSLSGGSWEIIDPTPALVGKGAAMAYAGGPYLYAFRGDKEVDFWRYLAVPPRYDVISQTSLVTTYARIEWDGSSVSVIFWDIQ